VEPDTYGRQDLHEFLRGYSESHPDDVLIVADRLSSDQAVTALAFELHARGRAPVLVCSDVEGLGMPLATNVFASRERVARILDTDVASIHQTFFAAAANRIPPKDVGEGPVLDERLDEGEIDLRSLPMIRHLEQDRAPYWTSAIVLARDPNGGSMNASYHRCMISSPADPPTLATSLHSRGHLWRFLSRAADRGESLPVAVVLGGHPLFMLASSARTGMEVDEREIAGGLFGDPLEVVPTPRYGIGVPATSDLVLEGVIDPRVRAEEGPFGEYSGYASARSTNNLIEVETVLRRKDPMLLDVVSGHSPDHLNLGRIPRESELLMRIRERYPEVEAIHYPSSGTHFHCYVSMQARVPGQPRQVLLALLGMDPYLKMAVAVDNDIDVRREEEVLWAVATRFQADRDLFVISGVPGSLLDPSSDQGRTSRLAIDATRKAGFEGERVTLSAEAVETALRILGTSGR
jgi:2,5-furandicarboxylate decarboxylase 1